ncbi:MAG: malic enzyme-like NAD(P)-binding protein [Rickettsiales bacterium]
MSSNLIEEALNYNANPTPGQISMQISKKLNLHLGYTPGIAYPCLEIKKDVKNLYKYTNVRNSVAVVSNGTAVLGLGNLGAASAMPVMEGKCVLLKYYANIDGYPIVLDSNSDIEIINIVKALKYSFGGINLEDIKAPECFTIENTLSNDLDIPIFHDDQHGTAIIVCSAILNATQIANKNLKDVKIVINGAGAAGIACAEMLKELGANNIILCDTNGAIFKGRVNTHPSKEKFAQTKAFILKDFLNQINIAQDNIKQDELNLNDIALDDLDSNFNTSLVENNEPINLEQTICNADIFIGVSAKNILSSKMILSMAENPIILALANPDPEILPEVAHKIRQDIIIGTGRSDFNNQVNNALCFPYMFRAALDTGSSKINMNMKLAAAYAIAQVQAPTRDILIPKLVNPFCSKTYNCNNPLLEKIVPAVAKAAINSNLNKINITNFDQYITDLKQKQTAFYKQMHLNGLI